MPPHSEILFRFQTNQPLLLLFNAVLLNRLLFVYFRDPRGAEIGPSFSAAGVEPTWERTYYIYLPSGYVV
jgi:hypothetical protein